MRIERIDPYLYLHRGISGGRSDQSEEGTSDWSDLPPLIPLYRYKYGSILSILIHTSSPVEDGTDTGFRNVGFYQQPDAGEIPRRISIITTTRRKLET